MGQLVIGAVSPECSSLANKHGGGTFLFHLNLLRKGGVACIHKHISGSSDRDRIVCVIAGEIEYSQTVSSCDD